MPTILIRSWKSNRNIVISRALAFILLKTCLYFICLAVQPIMVQKMARNARFIASKKSKSAWRTQTRMVHARLQSQSSQELKCILPFYIQMVVTWKKQSLRIDGYLHIATVTKLLRNIWLISAPTSIDLKILSTWLNYWRDSWIWWRQFKLFMTRMLG